MAMNQRPWSSFAPIALLKTDPQTPAQLQPILGMLNNLIGQYNDLLNLTGGFGSQIEYMMSQVNIIIVNNPEGLKPYDGTNDSGYVSNAILKDWPGSHWLLGSDGATLIDVYPSPTEGYVQFTAAAGPVGLFGGIFFDAEQQFGISEDDDGNPLFLATTGNFQFLGGETETRIILGQPELAVILQASDDLEAVGVGVATEHPFDIFTDSLTRLRITGGGALLIGTAIDNEVDLIQVAGSLIAEDLKDAALTEGRVVFVGADGKLLDSVDLTWGSGKLGIGTGSPQESVHSTGKIKGSVLISTVSTGTIPVQVVSTTLCTNLNADKWDGKDLPTLQSGKYLTNDGSTLSWGTVFSSGVSGQVLVCSGGTSASWQNQSTLSVGDSTKWAGKNLPSLESGKYLTNNASTLSWGTIFSSGASGQVLVCSGGTVTSWQNQSTLSVGNSSQWASRSFPTIGANAVLWSNSSQVLSWTSAPYLTGIYSPSGYDFMIYSQSGNWGLKVTNTEVQAAGNLRTTGGTIYFGSP